MRKEFIVVDVPFTTQNQCGAGILFHAYMPDRKELGDFNWGTNSGKYGTLPYREWQHDADTDRVLEYLEECVKKKAELSKEK